MEAYNIVSKARDPQRLSASDVINGLCDFFIELHGDRLSGDDQAVVGGIGSFGQQALTVIGIQKGTNLFENIERNFGMSGPSGYRKAQRLMKQAEKFNRPVLTLINTAGADATPESEDGGIGEAIASTLMTMAELTVPTLAVILGEGGSGGAIALALADEVWMLENSIYSILSPEGFASILWRDASLAPRAAEVMRLTALELQQMQVVDRVVDEQGRNREELLSYLVAEIKSKIRELTSMNQKDRLEQRQARFRKF